MKPFQNEFDAHMKGVYARFAERGQITLGQLIQQLEVRERPNIVIYDFAMLAPTTLASYRGYYEHLALGHTNEPRFEVTVADLLDRLREAVGQVFTGYKGGDYLMSENTPLWVANSGCTGGTAVVGVYDANGCVVIRTAYVED